MGKRHSKLQILNLKTLLLVLACVCLANLALDAQQQSLPPNLQDLFTKGDQALKNSKLDVAEEAFRRVLRDGGKVAFVYNNLGIVFQQRGEHQPAIDQFREAVRLQPDYAAPRILLGASLLALRKGPEAVRQLERAVKLQPREPLARLQL